MKLLEKNLPEWTELKNTSSNFYKFLNSVLFKDLKKHTSGQVETESLLLFGLLHCEGSSDKKAQVYLNMAKKQLNKVSQTTFSVENEKSCTLFNKLCKLASHGLYDISKQLYEITHRYTDVDLIKLQTTVGRLHEKFINTVFIKRDQPLQDAVFQRNIGLPSNNWIFDASQIRIRLAQLANIELKHFENQEQTMKRYNEMKKAKEQLDI